MTEEQRPARPDPVGPDRRGARASALLEEIRVAVRERRGSGLLPADEELDRLQERLWAMAAEAPDEPGTAAPEYRPHIGPEPISVDFSVEECEVLPSAHAIAWRRPVLGRVNALVRGQVNAEVRRYVDGPLARQTHLNYRLTELVQRLVKDQTAQATWAHHRLAELSAELAGLREEVSALREGARHLRSALIQLRDSVGEAGLPTPTLSIDYHAYSQRIGGGDDHVRALYAEFIPLFAEAAAPIVDLGCGRGVFLDLLREAGKDCLGVDSDPGMVRHAAARGHRVVERDVLSFLAQLQGGALGGIFAAHLVEHLPHADLVEFVRLCGEALAPGGHLVLVTPDPRSLFIFSDTFYKDLTHVAPLHPEALSFLVGQAGFAEQAVRTLSPPPADRRLELGEPDAPWPPALARNMAKLDALLYGDMDYALVARR